MNEVIKAILERQTIRSYKKEQITDEQLDLLMQAAKKAPSGRNMQPCHVRFRSLSATIRLLTPVGM